MKKAKCLAIVLSLFSAAPAWAGGSASPAPVPEVEESDVAVLPPAGAHWMFAYFSFRNLAQLIDGDTGKQLGGVHIAQLSNIAFSPDKKHIYVAETIWSKGNRGTRQDMITVYDGRTLKLDHEIPLPGRLLAGDRLNTFSISADGRYAYVYDMAPASSVIVVDLEKRKVLPPVEIPGCALAFAAGNTGVVSVCGDGSLAVISHAGGKAEVTQTAPFFDAGEDPVYDNSVFDAKSGKGYLLSYSGRVYEVTAGSGSGAQIAQPWSLQEGAHMPRAETKPLVVNWLPGGQQPVAYDAATGRLYVLMHKGEFWSYKEAGEELWEVDVATHKVLRRAALDKPAMSVAVSQDKEPLLFLAEPGGAIHIWDAATLSEKASAASMGPSHFVVAP
ncbi:amine dehydrogenase large subunit [Novosphingobium beihaiensis]|uniref:Methylamine dehydrogenase n=1 Tax=Novosphingobium beihaiensis TaxID=2930389 RepID=A0ABT0BLA0_9SPHN|nr:amine dehydrogenase large subunit [Novosphingobium beihaiensis]MCJ2185833.1 methylamine dehydrogenase [Novosphingobium beihaiensis]